MPRSHFLIVRLSVTNSGVTTSGILSISVSDRGGTSYPELTDAEGLSEWLGYIRTVKPADTLHGRVVFDVPTAEYELKLSDDAEPENVELAMVDSRYNWARPVFRFRRPRDNRSSHDRLPVMKLAHCLAWLTPFAIALPAFCAPKQLAIVRPALHQYEDGPVLERSFGFLAGERRSSVFRFRDIRPLRIRKSISTYGSMR